MKTKAIVSAVLTTAMAFSAIPFSASAEIMTEEEMRTTIEELAEENPDLDFSGLLNIKPPPGYEDMEPNPGILEAFAVYQVDDNIASFLEKHIATDKAGQLLNELYLKSWNEEMRNTYGDDYAETITKIKYLPIFMGVVKLDNGEYHPCELRKHWMGYEQVLFITGTIDPSYWQEEEINEDILTVEDYNKFSYEEAIIYALEYYNEHGEFLVGLGEAESGGLTITSDWNEEKVEETVLGDANCDGVMNMADAVLIMQNLSNPDKYPMYPQGRINADMDGNGMTNADALAIQKIILKLS